MRLNMNDAESIVRWWRVYPERHWDYIEYFAAHATPEFQASILEAQRRIQTDPRFARCMQRPSQAFVAARGRVRPGEEAGDDGGADPASGQAGPQHQPLQH